MDLAEPIPTAYLLEQAVWSFLNPIDTPADVVEGGGFKRKGDDNEKEMKPSKKAMTDNGL